jgi:hypothetical protein
VSYNPVPTDPRYPASYPQPGAPIAPTGPVARPTALNVGVLLALGAAVLTILAQVLAIAGGKDALRDKVLEEFPGLAAVGPAAMDLALDEAMDTIKTRAILGIVVAIVVAALALAARGASKGLRITLAFFLMAGVALMLRSVTDVFPGAAIAIGVLAMLLAPVAVIVILLPAVDKYRAARKAR